MKAKYATKEKKQKEKKKKKKKQKNIYQIQKNARITSKNKKRRKKKKNSKESLTSNFYRCFAGHPPIHLTVSFVSVKFIPPSTACLSYADALVVSPCLSPVLRPVLLSNMYFIIYIIFRVTI